MRNIPYWIFSFVICAQLQLFSAAKSYVKPLSDECKQARNAECFEGFDLSAGVGYGGITLQTTRGGIKPASNTSYGADGVSAQLKLSGNWAWRMLRLIGFEIYGQYNSAETENRFFETVTSSVETRRTFSMNWNLGIDLRLGIAPTSCSLLFLYGGPDWGYFDFRYATTGVHSTYEDFKMGWQLGAGLEQIFANCWAIKSTFDYRWYPSKTLRYSNGETQTIRARLVTALFSLGYLF